MTQITLQELLVELHNGTMNIATGGLEVWQSAEHIFSEIMKHATTFAQKATGVLIAAAHEEFFKSTERKKNTDLTVKERHKSKSILTEAGMLELQNDVYEDKGVPRGEPGRYCSPVLSALGIEPHQKISGELSRRLVSNSVTMSYAQSALQASGGQVCAQTAMNHTRKVLDEALLAVRDETELLRVEEVHVLIDEAHIACQHEDVTRTTVPFGVIAHGKETERQNRERLVGPVCFVDPVLSGPELVKTMEGYVAAHYDLRYLKRIWVHGDGAGYIRVAFEEFVQCKAVLDEFHLEKYLRRFVNCFDDVQGKLVNKALRKAIKDNDKDGAAALIHCRLRAQPEATKREKRRKKRMRQAGTYILNQWDSIVARKTEATTGSCTEPLVQHILASRMSSQPMAWTKPGAAKMALLRAARYNGMDLSKPLPQNASKQKYAEVVDNAISNLCAGRHDFSVFEKPVPIFNGDSGTQHAIAFLAKGGRKVA